MNCGVVYVCWGKKCIDELKKSIKSLNNNIPYLVVSDIPLDLNHIVVQYPNHMKSYARKICAYRFSPFEKTLYLDSDCVVLNSLNYAFSKLDHYDICICPSPYYSVYLNDFQINHYNTGVIFFKKSKNVEFLFEHWEESRNRILFEDEFEYDQIGISETIDKINPKFYSLSPVWNFRPHISKNYCVLNGDIIIWHSRDEISDALKKYLDKRNIKKQKWKKSINLIKKNNIWNCSLELK